ncbi:hypothetical protein ROLI_001740 [Roseobacter fucihabitans]|uniref:DUF1523 domain-containing protein n=1 Tax=Roseobacter fucihabitans TaxID=1537242 RepID=A0ABZ2BQD0_9RHOB|nr:DUF1523 family protein [Roseobacter litoralis]MBC6963424.1 hypothetical protein [Roseobacter litoralis]
MFYVKWFFIAAFWMLMAAFLHYTLPQVDIVRVTDTYEKRIDPGENRLFWAQADTGSNVNAASRDVFFIQSRRVDDKVMVYRNEDTGWGWPPYFKFDTSNLQAEASDLKATAAAPQYAAIRHYGWRIEFFTIFPNAISVWPVDGPDAGKPLPWMNVLILGTLAVIFGAIWIRWRRFREARIDPKLEEMQDGWEAMEDNMADRRSRLRRWWAAKRRGY